MGKTQKKIKLLIVDDELSSRDVLVGLLSNDDRKIQTAKDGIQAKKILKKEPIDLVLTDLNMPGLDGMGLLRFIKANLPQALVIMITGYATLESTLTAIKEGAYDYITKPFKLAEMDILVKNACEKIMLTRERDTLIQKIEKTQGEIEALHKRVKTMQGRIDQLEERGENLFLGNFDLRLSVSPESLPLRYGQVKEKGHEENLLISKLQEMRRSSEISEEDFHRYLKRLIKKEKSGNRGEGNELNADARSTATEQKRLT